MSEPKYVNLDTVSIAWLSIWTVLGATPVPIFWIFVLCQFYDSKRKTKTNFSCDNYFLLLVQRISVFFRGMDFNCLKYRNLIPFDLIWYSLRPVLRTLSRTSLKRVFAMHDFGSAQSNHKLMDTQRYCVEVGLHTCYHTFVYVVVFFVIFWYPYNFHEALDL